MNVEPMNARPAKVTPPKLAVSFGGFSSAGIKAENQDAFAARMPKNHEAMTKGAVAAIADGVSCASMAAEAAQLAVSQFIGEYYATPDTWPTSKSAAKVLTSLNQWLYAQSSNIGNTYQQNQQQWLTTFSTLIVKSATGYIFHVGDSRIVQYRHKSCSVITRDHHQKQGRNNTVLTRALGADPHLEVDVHQLALQPEDIYLLSCDGVHDYLSVREIETILATIPLASDAAQLELASKALVDKALANGSDDNVSCLLVYINELPCRDLSEIAQNLQAKAIPPALKPGTKIDDYCVLKVIHASIRSHLYLVQHPAETKPQVLKAPSANFADDALYLQGFIREAWVGERLSHPHIMHIGAPKKPSQFYYHIGEYLDGQTLTEWMIEHPKPSISKVRDLIGQLISALRAFQRLALVHRDLKPDNIMIDRFDQLKLIDYGTVWVPSLEENQHNIRETVPQGSLNYIAPETLLTLQATHQSDLFSLGVICYQLLCGELPYKPMTRAKVTFKHYEQWQYRQLKQFRPELPIWLDLTLARATSADPTSRYQAYSEFFTDLNKVNPSALRAYQQQPLLQRDPIKFWQGISLLLLVALLISLFN